MNFDTGSPALSPRRYAYALDPRHIPLPSESSVRGARIPPKSGMTRLAARLRMLEAGQGK